jgi:hypothetical protein
MKEQDVAEPCHIISARETELAPFARRAAEQSRTEQSSLPTPSFHPIFVSTATLLPTLFPSFPQTKRNEYSQGYIHCIPYGKVSFVTKLSPLQPGYVSTVCASPSPSSTNPTARTDNSCENMVIYTLLSSPLASQYSTRCRIRMEYEEQGRRSRRKDGRSLSSDR